ncbi:S26 family signal peptidase [Micromonospora okii]|uniref:S26 family signal peptidase n=1 Tax=Micromonospora okii TaxID=1182970 RepID=UPI001E4976BE|nr:S26 family signal peptidase [Micromonospora okii]
MTARVWWLVAGGVVVLGPVLVLLARAALSRLLVSVTVHGVSMEPTYRQGDRVLVRRRPADAGEVVVVEQPDPDGRWRSPELSDRPAELTRRRWLIKRVAAAPGDEVPRDRVPALADAAEGRVPPGHLVLLGDNPRASLDSRSLGYFPATRVLGTVVGRPRR